MDHPQDVFRRFPAGKNDGGEGEGEGLREGGESVEWRGEVGEEGSVQDRRVAGTAIEIGSLADKEREGGVEEGRGEGGERVEGGGGGGGACPAGRGGGRGGREEGEGGGTLS